MQTLIHSNDKLITEQTKNSRQKKLAEQKARESNKQHKSKINNEALKSFIDNGLNEEAAKLAITLIAKGLINNISISY